MAIEISVVIPVYHSAQYLPKLVSRLMRVLLAETAPFEIILVDDGSTDASWDVLSELWTRYPSHVMAIQLMRNYGQHNAEIQAGNLTGHIIYRPQCYPVASQQLHRGFHANASTDVPHASTTNQYPYLDSLAKH